MPDACARTGPVARIAPPEPRANHKDDSGCGMKVLYASAEVSPFASTGGLAEVAASLPAALRAQGAELRVISPCYGFLDHERHGLSHDFTFAFPRHGNLLEVQVHSVRRHGVLHHFLLCRPWFGEEQTPYLGDAQDIARFILFCQLTLACAWELRQRSDWFPDILHVNDWHCALAPFLLAVSRGSPDWAAMRSLLTIHNLAYQGRDAGAALYSANIPPRHQADLVYQDLGDNLLATGIATADIVTTVSPRYAAEIQTAEMGHGLDGIVRTRRAQLHGILNGIDPRRHNPETDAHIAARFNAQNFHEQRGSNRLALRQQQGLCADQRMPLVAMIGRLDVQKGLQLALPVLRHMLAANVLQFVSLGDGDPQLGHELSAMAAQWPGRMAVIRAFDDRLARQIYAGADLFLMPSLFEPCGIGQMLAMRYGALPLVRETGGLADTVDDYDDGRGDRGTGFLFHEARPDALHAALDRAIQTWHRRPAAWRKLQRRAMRRDFSQARSARAIMNLYRESLSAEVRP